MKLRIRKVSFIEVEGLNIWSYFKIYFFMLGKFLKKDIHDGNGLVIVRDSGGRYQGFISPNGLKNTRGILKKAIRENRVVQSDIIKEEVEKFFKQEKEFPRYCPVFKEEKFCGLAYFDFAEDILAEEFQIILRHSEWGGDFWKDKVLLMSEDRDIAEGLEAISRVFSVPVISDIKQSKKYKGRCVISQKSFRDINKYVRRMDLQNTFNLLKEVDISVAVCRIPFADEIGDLTEDEKLRNKLLISGAYVDNPGVNVIEQLQKVYGEDFSLWEKGEVACIDQYYAKEQGIYKLKDRMGEGTNVIDGKRVTTGVPDVWENSIYIMGPCTVLGIYVRDSDTIPSYIQKYVNKYYPNKYRVVNLGTAGFYGGAKENIAKLTLKRADIVVFAESFREGEIDISPKVSYVDLAKSFLRRDEECFFDSPQHANGRGSKRLADTIWEDALQKMVHELNDLYRTKEQRNDIVKRADYSFGISDEVKQFIQKLQRNKVVTKSGNIGAIVMNCNPFTLGHQYLVEKASAQVDYLYIFVVEEDKSYFAFQDRMAMVKKGTDGLKNVQVLPGGKYVLSASTMPEYFTKESRQDIIVCASDDLEIFGMYIAPALGITKRFVGEEPFDKITRQYNESMERILPEYGIELICIERKEDEENKTISASRVRKLLGDGRYEEIKKIVPETTYLYK